jgi:hypothetical protein
VYRTSSFRWPAALALAAMLNTLIAVPVRAQQAAPVPAKELIAVLDFGVLGGTREQGVALANQLRVEVLRTGKVTLVDRSQLEAILEEQALQQTGCTSQECAVQVGRILGIRQIVSGIATKVSENFWQVTALVVDVETSETLRAESLNHRGNFEDLISTGMGNLAKLLFPPSLAEIGAQVPPAPAPAAQKIEEEGGIPWWVWALGVVGIAALAAAARGGGNGSGGDGDGEGDTGSVGFSY